MSEEVNNPDQPESLIDMFTKLLGGEKETEDFFNGVEQEATMQEAWMGFRQMYLGMRSVGFTQIEALDVLAGFLYRIQVGEQG